jgi:chaperone BCS1
MMTSSILHEIPGIPASIKGIMWWLIPMITSWIAMYVSPSMFTGFWRKSKHQITIQTGMYQNGIMFDACIWSISSEILKLNRVTIVPGNEDDVCSGLGMTWPDNNTHIVKEWKGHNIEIWFNSFPVLGAISTTIKEEKRITLSSKTLDVNGLYAMCKEMCKKYEEASEDQRTQPGYVPKLFKNDVKGRWSIGNPWLHTKTRENVILDNEIHHRLFEAMDNFMNNNEEESMRLGMTRSLGIMLHGPPGTGKTSCIKMLSREYRLDTFRLSISQVANVVDMERLFEMLPNHPHILVIEDIDCVDSDKITLNRTNTKEMPKKGGDMLNALLQCMDGLMEAKGRVMIITTNHPERLDRALLRTRRIDLPLHLSTCTGTMIQKIYERFYMASLKQDIIDALGTSLTPAQVYTAFDSNRRDPYGGLQRLIEMKSEPVDIPAIIEKNSSINNMMMTSTDDDTQSIDYDMYDSIHDIRTRPLKLRSRSGKSFLSSRGRITTKWAR